MRGSFSGIDLIAMEIPDGAGPIDIAKRRRVPLPSGSRSKRQRDPGFDRSIVAQPKLCPST